MSSAARGSHRWAVSSGSAARTPVWSQKGGWPGASSLMRASTGSRRAAPHSHWHCPSGVKNRWPVVSGIFPH
eukprot:14302979-Alexandrium_andersonii.AAC.1